MYVPMYAMDGNRVFFYILLFFSLRIFQMEARGAYVQKVNTFRWIRKTSQLLQTFFRSKIYVHIHF
jgi:hypothetical protein